MPDAETPQFRVSNEGDPIPPVDLEDLKSRWNTWKQHLTGATLAAQSQEADSVAVTHRFRMVSSLEGFNHGQLLAPWKHGEDLDDAVFRLAATFAVGALSSHLIENIVSKVRSADRGIDRVCNRLPDVFPRVLIGGGDDV